MAVVLALALPAFLPGCAGEPANVATRSAGAQVRSPTVLDPGNLVDGDPATFATFSLGPGHSEAVHVDLGRTALLTRAAVLLAPGTRGRYRILARETESLPWVELVDRTREGAAGLVEDSFPPKRARFVMLGQSRRRREPEPLRVAEVRLYGTR